MTLFYMYNVALNVRVTVGDTQFAGFSCTVGNVDDQQPDTEFSKDSDIEHPRLLCKLLLAKRAFELNISSEDSQLSINEPNTSGFYVWVYNKKELRFRTFITYFYDIPYFSKILFHRIYLIIPSIYTFPLSSLIICNL